MSEPPAAFPARARKCCGPAGPRAWPLRSLTPATRVDGRCGTERQRSSESTALPGGPRGQDGWLCVPRRPSTEASGSRTSVAVISRSPVTPVTRADRDQHGPSLHAAASINGLADLHTVAGTRTHWQGPVCGPRGRPYYGLIPQAPNQACGVESRAPAPPPAQLGLWPRRRLAAAAARQLLGQLRRELRSRACGSPAQCLSRRARLGDRQSASLSSESAASSQASVPARPG